MQTYLSTALISNYHKTLRRIKRRRALQKAINTTGALLHYAANITFACAALLAIAQITQLVILLHK